MELILLLIILGFIARAFETPAAKRRREARRKWEELHPDHYDVLM